MIKIRVTGVCLHKCAKHTHNLDVLVCKVVVTLILLADDVALGFVIGSYRFVTTGVGRLVWAVNAVVISFHYAIPSFVSVSITHASPVNVKSG